LLKDTLKMVTSRSNNKMEINNIKVYEKWQ